MRSSFPGHRIVLSSIGLVLAVLTTGACAKPQPAVGRDGCYSVIEFGAKADGKTDDTAAFRKAVTKASSVGGFVLVPPVGPGRGYVITGTVRLPKGVSLIGARAGFGNDSWAAYDLPENSIHGSKIFARPAPSDYAGAKKRPLFLLEGGNTAKGLCILYDRQPWPTDQEFKDPKSPYHYDSFEKARDSFIKDHVKPYGPTFYLQSSAVNVVVEDIVCDRYYDFYFQAGGGKNLVDRIYLYGYNRGFVVKESYDVNRISNVHLCPNAGPACPGQVAPAKNYSWIYGIIVSRPDSVGIQLGKSDGYHFRDLFLYGVHTGIRFGASVGFPLRDPVEGVDCFYDPSADRLSGFRGSYKAGGPWGSISTLSVDCCTIGLHFVWPSANCTCMLTNCYVGTAFTDKREFPAVAGTGEMKHIRQQSPFLVEPTFSTANNNGGIPGFMCSNAQLVSYNVTGSFAGASAHAGECNGRAFLIGGDISMEFTNMRTDWPYDSAHLYAASASAGRYSIRVRGLSQGGQPAPGVSISSTSGRPHSP